MLVFDIETDGFLSQVTTIHCLVIHDTEENQTITFSDKGHNDPVVRGVQLLDQADCISGHNIIGYDIPVIHKLYPWFNRNTGVADTLLLSRLVHRNLMEIDKKNKCKQKPLHQAARHSVVAYENRLGGYKGEFSKHTNWKKWSPVMELSCQQGVNVSTKLCNHFATRLDGYN